MKINKYTYFVCSLALSMVSCWLFHLASLELHSDGEYMESLQLPSNADTPAVAMAGGFIAAIVAAFFHAAFHIFLFLRWVVRSQQNSMVLSLRIGKFQRRIQNITIAVCFMIGLIWISDYVQAARIRFFPYDTLFLLTAITSTFLYGWWVINIFIKKD